MILNLNLISPFKRLEYLCIYLKDIKQIYSNQRSRFELFYVDINLIYHSFICCTPYLFNWTPWTRRFIVDFMFMFHLPRSSSLAILPICWLLWQYTNMLYYHNLNPITTLIEDVIIYGDYRYFLFNGKEIVKIVRKYCRMVLFLVNQIFALSIGMF